MDDKSSSLLPKIQNTFDEYLKAMKKVYREDVIREAERKQHTLSERNTRKRHNSLSTSLDVQNGTWALAAQATRISIIASMVPDEIIYKHSDHSVRDYETALMFIDVSGFTELCECYTKAGRGGPSRLTQVLNTYIGSMVQEILTHNGDVLKFSGDAFISMWKKTATLTMQDVVHTAIDCGLIIQRNYGTYVTDVGVVLKVKVAISAGLAHFSIIGSGDIYQRSYVVVGQPVWDVKRAEYVSTAGDVLTSASAWLFVNEGNYTTEPCDDGRHTKILGVGATWKRVEKLYTPLENNRDLDSPQASFIRPSSEYIEDDDINYREFSLRPSVISAMRSTWWPSLRRFMVSPVLRAVDNDEPMDFLTEVRRVVVVFLNIITKTVTAQTLIEVVDSAYKVVCRIAPKAGGLVNKVSMFDKDMMFLVVFGLRGLKHESEAQKALECAQELKELLSDDNIMSVSIGVTSGTTYCGVVGHMLRREYTVIGSAVNRAARLMMVYVNKITCDKETFLRSKLDQSQFRLMDARPMKGIAKPGPIYEYNKYKSAERQIGSRHPILGRDEELRQYKLVFINAQRQRNERFTKYADHQYAIAFTGVKMVGKTRLMEECVFLSSKSIPVEKIYLTSKTKTRYSLIHQMATKALAGHARPSLPNHIRELYENRIRSSVDIMSLSARDIFAINTIFDCQFPLPEGFNYNGDLLAEPSVKNIIRDICNKNFSPALWQFAIDEIHYADDDSWRALLIMLDTKTIFVIMTLEESKLSVTAKKCFANNMIVKIHLTGIDRWYHAALACQLLDVQAIPADLEKIIQTASGGLPGWIQNFVIALVQRSDLNIVTLSRGEAVNSGAVLPVPGLLQRDERDSYDYHNLLRGKSCGSLVSSLFTSVSTNICGTGSTNISNSEITVHDSDVIQMAILTECYNFDNMKVDMTMDALILKTYDSLNPFEKMIVKCSSVLGDVFSRRMLLHLLQSDSVRNVALAIAKLFRIRVLECEGGDFTKETSLVMVNPSPSHPHNTQPHCSCLGINKAGDCRDLPMYAFCGYIKFRNSVFRTTTYELLTESHKQELHARALLYLERYTRRCLNCGSGCFVTLLGQRFDDGLVRETEEMKRIREQISAFSRERACAAEYTQIEYTHTSTLDMTMNLSKKNPSVELGTEGEELKQMRISAQSCNTRRIPSFSSLDITHCDCLAILLYSYSRIIEHCRGAVELEKLVEAYLEYADLNIIILNIPQAMKLLNEVENVVTSEKFRELQICEITWYRDYLLARIFSMRGNCMLESGDRTEARKQLLLAMNLFGDPFPNSKSRIKFEDIKASIIQIMALYVAPSRYVGRNRGLEGRFFEDIATTLNRLFRLFSECKEVEKATLAAKRSLNYALRTNANFRLLCGSYGSMITVYHKAAKFSNCLKLEKAAVDLCNRKYGLLDITEVHALCYLYVSIFLFYIKYGKKQECLKFGLSTMPMMTTLTDLATRQTLVLCMLMLLLSDIRINDMVVIMRDFFYIDYNYDLSSETWYYCTAMVILLDTGYCVESYKACENFYEKRGDAILRSRTPESAWCFFIVMWILTLRVGVWELTIVWEEKINQLLSKKLESSDFDLVIKSRLVEGLLLSLVIEIDNKSMGKIFHLQRIIKELLQDIKILSKHYPMQQPRYHLLFAYFLFLRGKRMKAFKELDVAYEVAQKNSHQIVLQWVEHTRNHWNGNLNPALTNYWVKHIELGYLLDYRDLDTCKVKIVPYTLPLPKDFLIEM